MKELCISLNVSVRDAITAIDNGGKKVVFIVDASNKLMGIFTDGDMRKFILGNGDISANISKAMNSRPIVFSSLEEARIAKEKIKMIVYPIVNDENTLVDALFWDDLTPDGVVSNALQKVPLIMMAGGKGTRLYPFTKILPKPLIPIGEETISERIINIFTKYGCKKVWMVLNYKSNMIKSYYNDLNCKYSLDYVDEKEFLGTGGGLSLLKGKIDNTAFVSNCDILVNADLECIYKTHKQRKNKITLVCVMKNMQIPYGIINLDDHGQIESMTEKPKFSFLTNTGLYVVEPEVIERIPQNKFIHLPDIVQEYLNRGERVGVFPISEKSWLDMGQISEMKSMIEGLKL